MNARREGYRLVGDYVLTGTDALDGKMFPDRISYGGWPLDTHDPLGMDNPRGDGYWKHHSGVPTYTIPYRCLYSRNIPASHPSLHPMSAGVDPRDGDGDMGFQLRPHL